MHLLAQAVELFLMFIDINDLLEVYYWWLIQPALFLASDKFDIIDGKIVLFEIADMMFVIFLKSNILVLQLLYAQLQIFNLFVF